MEGSGGADSLPRRSSVAPDRRERLGESLIEQAADLAAGGPGRAANPAASVAKFTEAELLIINAAESLPADRNTPRPIPHGPDRTRQTLERASRLAPATMNWSLESGTRSTG